MDDDSVWVPFLDLLFITTLGLVALIALMIAHINPKAQLSSGQEPPGNVVVEITWAPENGADVDLWVQGPGDVPVGYSNKGGVLFNLLRDDLGSVIDISGINYEVSYSRGMVPGEYTVNIHLFRMDMSHPPPFKVTVQVSSKCPACTGAKRILDTVVTLNHEGEEVTAFRFALNAKGNVVPGSVTTLFKSLRTWKP